MKKNLRMVRNAQKIISAEESKTIRQVVVLKLIYLCSKIYEIDIIIITKLRWRCDQQCHLVWSAVPSLLFLSS